MEFAVIGGLWFAACIASAGYSYVYPDVKPRIATNPLLIQTKEIDGGVLRSEASQADNK
jgi:hypothetical protein